MTSFTYLPFSRHGLLNICLSLHTPTRNPNNVRHNRSRRNQLQYQNLINSIPFIITSHQCQIAYRLNIRNHYPCFITTPTDKLYNSLFRISSYAKIAPVPSCCLRPSTHSYRKIVPSIWCGRMRAASLPSKITSCTGEHDWLYRNYEGSLYTKAHWTSNYNMARRRSRHHDQWHAVAVFIVGILRRQ